MKRLRARIARLMPDAVVLAGLVLISAGTALAWLPAGLVVAGFACLWVVRFGSEAER